MIGKIPNGTQSRSTATTTTTTTTTTGTSTSTSTQGTGTPGGLKKQKSVVGAPSSSSATLVPADKPRTDAGSPATGASAAQPASSSPSSSPCGPCKYLLPISTAVLMLSIAIPVLMHCAADKAEDDGDGVSDSDSGNSKNVVVDDDDGKKQGDGGRATGPITFVTNLYKKLVDSLNKANGSKLSAGDQFTPNEYVRAESL